MSIWKLLNLLDDFASTNVMWHASVVIRAQFGRLREWPTNVTPLGKSGHRFWSLKFRGIKSQVKKTETMAQFVIGSNMVDDSVRKEKERKEQENQEKARRHYKKDSR